MLIKIAFIIDEFFKNIQDTIFTSFALLFFSKINKKPHNFTNVESCIVLGNGPSLKNDYFHIKKFSSGKDSICLNDFAESEMYVELKPKYYILQDPYYWDSNLPEKYIDKRFKLYERINLLTMWEMILLVPWDMKSSELIKKKTIYNPNIKIYYYNRIPITGFKWFRFFCFKFSLGIPSGQNILITSIFIAIKLNYNNIYVAGADHSLHENILVDDDNIVYVKQNHFYDNKIVKHKPYSRSYVKKNSIKIHELFTIWAKAFNTYILLDEYSKKLNKNIFNVSSVSFIDAFQRKDISKI